MNLETYIRQRCRKLGISISDLCRDADISRQTLYKSWNPDQTYPSLNTLVQIALALKTHPLKLLQLLFNQPPFQESRQRFPDDASAFIDDVTYPDGEQVFIRQRFQKVWCIQNVGSQTWRNRALVCQDESLVVLSSASGHLNLANGLIPDQTRIELPETAPGETLDIKMTFTAPDGPCTVLSYWKLVSADGSFCFPDSRGLWVKVRVVSPALAAGITEKDWNEID